MTVNKEIKKPGDGVHFPKRVSVLIIEYNNAFILIIGN